MKSAIILTYSGVEFDIFNPDPDKILIEDIAHALSMQCRFSGHTRLFYSVAEHSVACANLTSGYKLEALMHDSAEAYLHDMISPLKKEMPEYVDLEDKIMKVIASKFEFKYPIPAQVHGIDKILLDREQRTLMTGYSSYRINNHREMPPAVAERLFLDVFFKMKPELATPKYQVKKGVCRICGCTEDKACYDYVLGPCWWADDTRTLCSHCSISFLEQVQK